MKLLALLLLVQTSAPPEMGDDSGVVTSITIRANNLTDREMKLAQRYASCVSMPYFALEAERQKKFEKCRPKNLRRMSAELKNTFGQIEHIIIENGGSEASLYVKRDNAPNQ